MVREETSPEGQVYLDEAIHKCRTNLTRCENEADSSLTSLAALTDEFADYSEEYNNQVEFG